MIHHIVMWKLKDATDAAQFKAELDSCSALVPGMQRFEVHTKRDDLEANCDVILISAFDSRAALEAYQVHPHHKAVSARLGLLRESRSVLDYEAH
jgi:quinol monooxygenase YgiN